MAGRGRGRRTMSFSIDAVGINRGDSLPPSMQQPTPLFPVRLRDQVPVRPEPSDLQLSSQSQLITPVCLSLSR